MMLVAWELGIGSVPATVYRPTSRSGPRLPGRPALRVPAVVRIPCRPEDLTRPPKPGGRLPLDELVHRERW